MSTSSGWFRIDVPIRYRDIDYVIGEVQVRYHLPIMYPGTVRAGVRLERIGGKSIRLAYEIRSGDALHVTGETTHVMYDRASNTTFAVDAVLRDRLETYFEQE